MIGSRSGRGRRGSRLMVGLSFRWRRDTRREWLIGGGNANAAAVAHPSGRGRRLIDDSQGRDSGNNGAGLVENGSVVQQCPCPIRRNGLNLVWHLESGRREIELIAKLAGPVQDPD